MAQLVFDEKHGRAAREALRDSGHLAPPPSGSRGARCRTRRAHPRRGLRAGLLRRRGSAGGGRKRARSSAWTRAPRCSASPRRARGQPERRLQAGRRHRAPGRGRRVRRRPLGPGARVRRRRDRSAPGAAPRPAPRRTRSSSGTWIGRPCRGTPRIRLAWSACSRLGTPTSRIPPCRARWHRACARPASRRCSAEGHSFATAGLDPETYGAALLPLVEGYVAGRRRSGRRARRLGGRAAGARRARRSSTSRASRSASRPSPRA